MSIIIIQLVPYFASLVMITLVITLAATKAKKCVKTDGVVRTATNQSVQTDATTMERVTDQVFVNVSLAIKE